MLLGRRSRDGGRNASQKSTFKLFPVYAGERLAGSKSAPPNYFFQPDKKTKPHIHPKFFPNRENNGSRLERGPGLIRTIDPGIRGHAFRHAKQTSCPGENCRIEAMSFLTPTLTSRMLWTCFRGRTAGACDYLIASDKGSGGITFRAPTQATGQTHPAPSRSPCPSSSGSRLARRSRVARCSPRRRTRISVPGGRHTRP